PSRRSRCNAFILSPILIVRARASSDINASGTRDLSPSGISPVALATTPTRHGERSPSHPQSLLARRRQVTRHCSPRNRGTESWVTLFQLNAVLVPHARPILRS